MRRCGKKVWQKLKKWLKLFPVLGYNKDKRYEGGENMTITITPQGAAWFIIAVLAMVLLVYLILLLRKLIGTLKKVDLLLDDSKIITEVASRRTTDVDGMVDGVVEAVGIMTDAVKGNQNIAKAASSVVNAAATCAGIIKGKNADAKKDK